MTEFLVSLAWFLLFAGGGIYLAYQRIDLRTSTVATGLALLAYTVFVGGVVVPTLAGFWKERLGVTPSAALWSMLVGGGTALLGEIHGGVALRTVLGPIGGFVSKALGPEYGSILPVVLSGLTLFLVSWVPRRSR